MYLPCPSREKNKINKKDERKIEGWGRDERRPCELGDIRVSPSWMATRDREEGKEETRRLSVSQHVSSREGKPMKKFRFDKCKKNAHISTNLLF